MKKSLKLLSALLAVSLCICLSSCGGDTETTSSAAPTAKPVPTVIPVSSTVVSVPTVSEPDPADTVELIAKGAEFACLTMTTDDYNAFIADHADWNTADFDRADWTTASAPLGDRLGNTAEEIGWVGEMHGLLAVTTFTVEDASALKDKKFAMNIFYDNTCTIYVNGNEVFSHIGDTDWVDDYTDISLEKFGEFLVDGENVLAVSLLDGWGGRELDLSLTAQ